MNGVLSLLPSATEIIFALGAEDTLVGVTHECDFPLAARSRPMVTSARIDPSMRSDEIDRLVREQLDDSGTLYALDLPLVASLRPSIVLTQQLCTVCAVGFETVRAAMKTLEEPPEVVNLEPKNLEEVFGSILEVGRLVGRGAAAEQVVVELRNRLGAIPRLDPTPDVLFLEWLVPPFSAGHWMPELIEAAGARTVLSDRNSHSRSLSWEQIRSASFDTLVVSCCGFSVERAMLDIQGSAELDDLRRERPDLRVILFDGNHFFSRPGPRLVESAELLSRALCGVIPENAGSSVPDPYRLLS